MTKEWSVRCPVCETRLVLDARTRSLITHQPGQTEPEVTDERARDLGWDAALRRVRGRKAQGEDRLEAALQREQRRTQDLDGLYDDRFGEGHAGIVDNSSAALGHGSVTGTGESPEAGQREAEAGVKAGANAAFGPQDWGGEGWMRSLDQLEDESLLRRAQARTGLDGDPFGVRIARIGGLTVIRCKRANSVFGLSESTAADFPEAVRFLEGCEGDVHASVLPEGDDDEPGEGAVARELDAAGWRLKLLDPVWVRDLREPDPPDSLGVKVRRIEPGEERVFARTLETCFEPQSQGQRLEENVERLALELAGENWVAFLGEVEGRPVAASCGFLGEQGLHLQLAATDPAFRGRGFQRAMIRARLEAGRAAGLRWAVGGPKRYTASQRAFRSEGFELGFVKALYSPA